jgi:hypothetical protein
LDLELTSLSESVGAGVPSRSGLASTSRNAVSHAFAVSSGATIFFPRFGGIKYFSLSDCFFRSASFPRPPTRTKKEAVAFTKKTETTVQKKAQEY